MGAIIEKFRALLQWFVLLEREEHGHWCVFNFNDDEKQPTWKRDAKRAACPHKGYRWMCKGIFCAGIERVNCPACQQWDELHEPDLEAIEVERITE